VTDPAWGLAPRAGAGDVPSRADVLVVGGGITGVSLLYHLREVGAVLVERDRLAAGASGRNAGFIVQGVGHNYAEAVRTYGRSRARDTWAFSVETHDLLEDALAGRSPHHRRRGHATVPVDDGERRALEESAALMADDGFEARWEGGQLVFPGDGEHNPTETVCALASFAAPGAVRDGVDVTAIEPSGGEVRVAFGERGECRAGVVVLATNAYTSRLLPEAGIAPNRAQMAATAPESRTVVTRPTGRPDAPSPGVPRRAPAGVGRHGTGHASLGRHHGLHLRRPPRRRRAPAQRVGVRRLQRQRHVVRLPLRPPAGRAPDRPASRPARALGRVAGARAPARATQPGLGPATASARGRAPGSGSGSGRWASSWPARISAMWGGS
jgi:glycine/D-amino acid oxidase-like deaminating enzyme